MRECVCGVVGGVCACVSRVRVRETLHTLHKRHSDWVLTLHSTLHSTLHTLHNQLILHKISTFCGLAALIQPGFVVRDCGSERCDALAQPD